MMTGMTLYEVLGLDPTASIDDIKRAYRKLARETHPDATGSKDDTDFKNVNHAHEILSDPEKKRHYDETGEHGVATTPAENVLVQHFQAAMIQCINTELSGGWIPDPKELMNAGIQKAIDHFQGTLRSAQAALPILKKARKRARHNGKDKGGAILRHLDTMITSTEGTIGSVPDVIQHHVDALSLLQHYSFTGEGADQTQKKIYQLQGWSQVGGTLNFR